MVCICLIYGWYLDIFGKYIYGSYIWVNCNYIDLTVLQNPGIMVLFGNHHFLRPKNWGQWISIIYSDIYMSSQKRAGQAWFGAPGWSATAIDGWTAIATRPVTLQWCANSVRSPNITQLVGGLDYGYSDL